MLVSIVLLVILSQVLATPALAQERAPTAEETFAALLERVKRGDRTVDFRELRFAYTETSGYDPYPFGRNAEDRKGMFSSLNDKQFGNALEYSERVLAKNYVDLSAHFVAYVAHRELGNVEKPIFHKYVLDGLVRSITSSGDGKSLKTAYVVISIDEEYALMHFLGLRRAGQALVREEGHSYDRMTGVDRRTNATVTLYFNIDKPLSWAGRRRQELGPRQ